MSKIHFSVDAHLLEELGERLVAKPSVALAELVKNAYDADATRVEIDFAPQEDRIVVRDDGHGMTREGVRDFWMRIGTTNKTRRIEEGKGSLLFGRTLTGSKGVGRLSVQFLANVVRMTTVPHPKIRGAEPPYWIETKVDWREAVRAGDLTNATAEYRERRNEPPWPHGTEIELTALKKREWNPDEIRDLAKEIWWLRPPFESFVKSWPEHERFEIRFEGPIDFAREFREQLDAVEYIQIARLVGEIRRGRARVRLEFWKRGQPYDEVRIEYSLAHLPHNGGEYDPDVNLHDADFEIRIYKLRGRQPKGIRLQDLRDYLDRFAGIHVYDAGFRLPYYGDPSNDWLLVEYDHAHRIFESRLLPKDIQEAFKHTERLRYLPTLRRIIGMVRVDTSKEPGLDISITRDRLMETRAYEDLRLSIRYALDWYAYQTALRAYEESRKTRKVVSTSHSLARIEALLKEYRGIVPSDLRKSLEEELRLLDRAIRSERVSEASRLALLAPLATAGVSSMAVQHEMRKLLRWLDDIRHRLASLVGERGDDSLTELIDELERWSKRAREANALFDFLVADTTGRKREKRRYRARIVLERILEQVAFFAQGVEIHLERLPPSLLLPPATYAEWVAVFQNVLVNAFNAMRSSQTRILDVSAQEIGKERMLRVQDTGVGIDLEKADEYFEPFVRGIDMDPKSARLGFGGMGLGLTIVRLVADHIGCEVGFTEPEEGFSTCFFLRWEEVK